MKLNILQFFIIIIVFGIVISIPNVLNSFSEIELSKGSSEYIYNYSNPYPDKSITPYIYIKLTDNEKINLSIYLNSEKIDFSEPKNDEWINIPIDNKIYSANITLKINNLEVDLKMIFIDSTKSLNLSLEQFLNLNFNTRILSKRPPRSLHFEITVDKTVYFALEDESNNINFDNKYLLIFQIEDNNECTDIGTNNVELNKGKKYLFILISYEDKNVFYFKKIKLLYYIEEIFFKNNTFTINNFTRNNYLILDLKNHHGPHRVIYFYIDDNSGINHKNFKMISISKDKFNELIKKNFNIITSKFEEITNGKITEFYYKNNIKEENEYLIIYINNKSMKNKGFILFFSEIYYYFSTEISKGEHILLDLKQQDYPGILLSNQKNMKILFQSENEFTHKIFYNNEERYIYVDSSDQNTKLFYKDLKSFDSINNLFKNKFINDYDLKDLLNQEKNDNFFIRKTSNFNEPGFYSYYFFDIEEQYYIYNKKYFGGINIYKYKLNINTTIDEFNELIKPVSYYDKENFEIINNKLVILYGKQFYNFYLNYGSFFDFFIQKVNDFDYININIEDNKYNKNIVKLLNKEKLYYIKFELNHLIKLDYNFLDAEITFIKNNRTKYILNDKNKIIYLEGSNFTVKSNKIAILFFYEKFQNYNNNSIIEFDESQFGKNMKINIMNKNDNDIKIAIAKDFGFKNYYPMINFQDLEILTIQGKKISSIYIENYYDPLEINIYKSENEKYYIYIFEIQVDNKLILLNNENIEISLPLYFDSITKFSKYNFNLIPNGNKTLILESSKKFGINYHFVKCSNDDITFKLKSIESNGNYTIKENQINNLKYYDIKFEQGQTLIHHFDSKNKFLLLYDFSYKNRYYNFYNKTRRLYD